MLKNVLDFNGVKQLNKNELGSINGGGRFTVTCSFPDGSSWQGHTHDVEAAADMILHCRNSNGSDSYHADLWITDNHH